MNVFEVTVLLVLMVLQEGETIRINVKTKPGSGTGMLSGATGPTNVISSTGRMKAPLAPPPGGGRIRSPLPPPPNDNKSVRTSPVSSGTAFASSLGSAHDPAKSWDLGRASADPFSDLSQLEVLPAHLSILLHASSIVKFQISTNVLAVSLAEAFPAKQSFV